MPVFKKIKAKAKNSRGSGEDFIIEQFLENTEGSWFPMVKEMPGAEQDEHAAIFDNLDGCEDLELGQALFKNENDAAFKMAKADMSPEQIKAFCDKLCPEYFEAE